MSRWWIQSYFPDSKCLGKLNPFQNCLNRRSQVAKSLSFKISSFDFDFKAFKTKIYKKAKQIIRHESLKILQKRGNKNQYTFIEKSIECCFGNCLELLSSLSIQTVRQDSTVFRIGRNPLFISMALSNAVRAIDGGLTLETSAQLSTQLIKPPTQYHNFFRKLTPLFMTQLSSKVKLYHLGVLGSRYPVANTSLKKYIKGLEFGESYGLLILIWQDSPVI